jgi:hypothetical protein
VNAASIAPQKVLPADNNSKNASSLKSGETSGKSASRAGGFDAILSQIVDGRNMSETFGDRRTVAIALDQSALATGTATSAQSPTPGIKPEKRDVAAGPSVNPEPSMTPASAQQLNISAALSSLAALPALTSLAAGVAAPSSDPIAPKTQQPSPSISPKAPLAGAGPSRALMHGLIDQALPETIRLDTATQTGPLDPQNQAAPFNQPATAPSTRIVSTHVETHFAPAQGPSPPTQQVATALLNELGGDANPDPTALGSTPAGQPPTQPSNSTLKVLIVHLEPADLGSVAIKMRLTGNHLDMEVMAAQHDTLRALSSDHDRLRDMLQSCGYSIDHLSIKASPSAQSGSSDNQNASQRNPQNQTGEDLPSGFDQSGSERGNSREKMPKENVRTAALPEDRNEVPSTDRTRLGRYI